MLWLFVVLVLTTSCTACLSSMLTAQKLEPVWGDNKMGYNGAKLKRRYELQLPRTLPVSSPQVAPEPCVDLPPNNV